MTSTHELTAAKQTAISMRVLALISEGMNSIDALKQVCGAEVVDAMIDGLYHDLRNAAAVRVFGEGATFDALSPAERELVRIRIDGQPPMAKSAKKAETSRINGLKGGRPRKSPTDEDNRPAARITTRPTPAAD
jgi:hypothetical protein